MRIILVLSISAILAACGARVKTMIGLPVVSSEISHMEGVKQTVVVGDSMTSSAPLIIAATLKLERQIESSTTHKGRPRNLVARPGIYRLIRENSDGKFYESADGTFRLNNQAYAGGLFLSNKPSVPSALYWSDHSSPAGHPMSMYMSDVDSMPKTTLSTSQRPPNDSLGFVSTLTYTGMSGGQIKFVYREYTNGLARDAFTQDVSLDYVAERTYAYKAARFLVHDANTSEITFTLLQPL